MDEPRKANRADVPALATALARAFDDDPVIGWVFPDPRRRARFAERLFAMRLRDLIRQQETYTLANRGGALWAVPGGWKVPALEQARMVMGLARGLGVRAPRILSGLHEVETCHPREPHYYLAVLGVDPDDQGRGMGSALMRPVLAACDGDGVPAYLESSKERNVDFYARHGFRVTDELRLPAGPPVWLMWRDPR